MRRTSVRIGSLIGSTLVLLACGKTAPPAPAPEPTPQAAATKPEAAESPARKLALASSQGNSPVDLMIAQYQKKVAASQLADGWVVLGRAWIRKARESSDPGFYLNAKACADVALELQPDYPPATDLVAMVLLNDHKFADARDLARDILAKHGEDLQALGTLSDAENELGEYAEAMRAIDKMVDLKPNLPSYIRVHYAKWLRGDLKGAQETVRLAIDAGMDKNDPEPRCWAMVQAGLMFWHQGDYEGADKGFETTMKSCSEYPPALAGRGRVAMANGNFARAAELFERAYKQSPLVETAWLLGDAKKAAGDDASAEKLYADVVKHGKQTDPRTLALFYATHDRDHDDAVKLALDERKSRDDLYTEDAIAWAQYRAGQLEQAREASDKAIALGTKDARLLYHAGAIRMAQGEKDDGEKLVKEALKLNPKFDWVGSAEAAKLVDAK